jgi:hypothetical protein
MRSCIPTQSSKNRTRSITLRLPVDLLDTLREMGRDASRGEIQIPRDLRNMIKCSLMWAVWAHSHGRGPDAEIGRQQQGYIECDLVIRARRERREVEYLERLYRGSSDACSRESGGAA